MYAPTTQHILIHISQYKMTVIFGFTQYFLIRPVRRPHARELLDTSATCTLGCRINWKIKISSQATNSTQT